MSNNIEKKQKNRIILVLGMHRSGTSALAGSLDIAGGNLGTNLLAESFDNPKGFFENSKVVSFNNHLLAKLNLDWSKPVFFDSTAWSNILEIEREKINLLNILHEEFKTTSPLIIKDPRISILLPIWQLLLKEDFELEHLIIFRNPKNVIKSLNKRNKFVDTRTLSLWLCHYISILKHSNINDSHFISFEQLIKDPIKCIKKIDSSFSLNLNLDENIFKTLNNFLERDLSQTKHTKKIQKNLTSESVNNLYQVLKKLSGSKVNHIKELLEIPIEIEKSVKEFYSYENNETLNFARLIVRYQNSNTLSYSSSIKSGINNLKISIDNAQSVLEILLFPSNKYSLIKLFSIKDSNGVVIPFQSMRKSVLMEHGNLFVTAENSFFKIENSHNTNFDKLIIEVEYINIGNESISKLDLLGGEINKWIQSNIYEYKDKYETVSIENENHISAIGSLKAEIITLKNNINDYVSIIDTNKSIIHSFENEVSEKDKTLNINSNKIEKLKLEIESLKTENHKIEELIKKQEISSVERSATIQTIQEINENLQLEKEQLLADLLLMQKDVNDDSILRQYISDNKKLEQELHALDIQNVQNVLRLEFFENKIKELQDEISQLRQDSKELNSERSNVAEELQSLKLENITKEAKIEKLQFQLELSIKKIEELKYVIDSDESLYSTLLNESNNLLLEKEDVELKLINAENSNYELKNKLGKLEDEKHQIFSEIETLKKEIKENQLVNDTESDDDVHLHEASKLKLEELIQQLDLKNNEIQAKELKIQKIYQSYLDKDNDIGAITNSLSYKIGRSVTLPARWVYDKTTGQTKPSDSKMWLVKKLVQAGIKNPVETLKKTNPKNLKTLKQALKSESSEQIYSNFQKLVGEKNELNHSVSENLDVSNSISKHGKILYISPHLPDFDNSSGGKRATRMLALLSEEFEVYAFTLGEKPEKYINKLLEYGVITIQTKNYTQIKKRIPKFDAIVYAWYYTIFEVSQFISLYPEAKLIMDTVDVHWVREERSIGLLPNLTKEKVTENKKSEIKAYTSADCIWAVTIDDKEKILQEIPEADIRVVSNIHEIHESQYVDHGTNNMLFFGGFKHYPNISAVKIAAKELLPLVRKEIPDATLIIAGSHAPQEVIDLSSLEGVEYRGFIEEEGIETLYKDTFIAVAPLIAGAGIKGKICEAIAYAVPVATNRIGNEGINLVHGEDSIIADNINDMANGIIHAMHRNFNLQEFITRSQSKLVNLVGPSIVKEQMVRTVLPEISICIVTWNRLDLVQRCIQSIEGNTNYPFYKILVHSNGCEDGTQEYLKAASSINSRIIPILSETNDVFVKPNNGMMNMFPANDAVLVNNDVYVTENWLLNLYNAAYSDDEIGIAGSKILYPNGKLQEFGSELYEDGTGRNIGKWEDPNDEAYKKMKRVGYVSGCSMYIKRSTMDKIGVFDLQFHPCYCEDSDYCYSAWENGIQTVVTPDSIIYHDEGGTSGTDEDSGFKAYQKVNFEKFLKKHKDRLGEMSTIIKSLN